MNQLILAEREGSGMTSSWAEFLCLSADDNGNVNLHTGRRVFLGEASEYYDEESEEYMLPDEVDGTAVWGVKDGDVYSEEIEDADADEDWLALTAFDDAKVKAWLADTDWVDELSLSKVRAAFNKLTKPSKSRRKGQTP